MATTFRDFIVECDMYPHSLEAYELMKECCELQVTAQFLENQEFLQENAAILTDGNVTFTEGYFAETVDSATIESIEASFYEKANNIGAKISNGFKKLLQTFVNLLVKLANKLDSQVHTANQIRAAFKKNGSTYSDDVLNKIAEVIRKAQGENSAFVPHDSNPSEKMMSKLDANIKNVGIRGKEKMLPSKYLFAALSDTYVIADTSGFGEQSPITADDLSSICKKITANSARKGAEFAAVRNYMSTIQKNINSTGLKINVNASSIKKVVDELNELLKKFESNKNAMQGYIDANKGKPADEIEQPVKGNKKAAGFNAYQLNDIYSRLVPITSNTIKVYTSLASYRSTIINGLAKIVLGKDTGSEENK